MEVFSPRFVAVKSAKTVTATAGHHGPMPSIVLPLQFVGIGIASLLAGSFWLVWQPELLAAYHYNQYVIAAVHLFVLGWICSVIMGAMYQLVPVALETKLHSERLARWHFAIHLVGFAGMVSMFRVWNLKLVGVFGVALAVGAGLFIYNLLRTLRSVPRWNVVATGIAASLVWLTLAVAAGLYVVCAKLWNFSPFDPIAQMHAHAHLGGFGFFVMMIVAVSYKLVPMFALSELQSRRRATSSLVLLNLGLAGSVTAILMSSAWKIVFVLLAVVGLAIYGFEIRAILRARKRRALDWAMRYFVTAIVLLVPVSLLGLALAWPNLALTPLIGQLENAYGFLALVGVISFAILGMLYKIVPFLVWFATYSSAIGRKKVPSLAELHSSALQEAGYWLFLIGVTATTAAIVSGNETAVRASCAGLLTSILVFSVNMIWVLRHLVRPMFQPLDFAVPIQTNR